MTAVPTTDPAVVDGIQVIKLPLERRADVNTLLIEGEPLTLVDTGLGTPPSLEALRAGLARHGRRLADIEQIVVTHAHLDHFGAAAAIVRESGARVIGDAGGVAVMADFQHDWEESIAYRLDLFLAAGAPPDLIDDTRAWAARYRQAGESVAVDVPLRAGDTVAMGGAAWAVVAVPGHAASSIALHDAARGLLLSGDILLGQGGASVTLHRVGDGALPAGWQETILESLARLAALRPRRVYPGHGPRLDDPAAAVADRVARVERRLARVLDLLDEPRTGYEISTTLYEPPIGTTWVGLSQALGYLDALETRGQAVASVRAGIRRYQRAGAPDRWQV